MGSAPPIPFHGCDYLGLARDARVLDAARSALGAGELGVAASPATTGRRAVHDRLELAVADFLGTEAAAVLNGGALANLAAAEALGADRERAWVDPRAHPSLRAARAAAGLAAAEAVAPGGLAFADGVYPARGEPGDLAAIREALGPGGTLVVDDAHGFGVRGAGGRGSVAEELGAAVGDTLVVIALSKALGAAGAAIAGSAARIDRIRRTDAYVGATALAPVLAAGAEAALAVLATDPRPRERLLRHVTLVRARLEAAGLPLTKLAFPVLALPGEARLRAALLDAGLDVPFIRYPDGVGGADGYLRLSLSAAHSDAEVEHLADTLARLLP